MTTPAEVVERVLALSAENPAWGCMRLADQLELEGMRISSPTVQSILIKHGVGTKYERLLKLEERMATEPIELTVEQIRLIEKANPCFRERHVESSRPGELLAQDTFYVGNFKGLGKVYMQAVVDTFGSYGFATLHTSKRPETAALILHNEVLPFYAERGISVGAVLTDNGREFCGTEHHPFELYLALNSLPSGRRQPDRGDIEHRRTRVRRPQTNGFVERFHRTVLDEFFRISLRDAVFDQLDKLQARLDAWLVHYNHERPHQGYRNMGRRPIDTINQASATVRHDG
jgi:transposase InsO family protein